MNPDLLPARSLRSMAVGASARDNMSETKPPDALVGLDVGGTMIKGLLLTSTGEILAEETTPTKDDGTTGWRDRAKSVVNLLLKRCAGGQCGIGVAAPGLASPDNRCITSLPERLRGLAQ